VRIENPAALRFIMQDDIYLLHDDKGQAIKTAAEPVIETPAVQFNYLGGHKKKFLVVVHYPDHEFIADEHLAALQNILKRKEHSLDDVAILNMAKAVADLEQLMTYFSPQKLLILGAEALPAKMLPPALNQPQKLADCMALYSFSFKEMMDNTDHKRIFWEQMKSL
jgi:hypothetical protein